MTQSRRSVAPTRPRDAQRGSVSASSRVAVASRSDLSRSRPRSGPPGQARGITALGLVAAVAVVACVLLASVGVAGTAGSAILWVLALVVAAHVVVNGRAGSAKAIIATLRGRLADVTSDARLLNLIDGLCSAFGVAAPEVVVIDSDEVNAITFATGSRKATLVVTSGAVTRLDRIELESLVAHELAHLRRGDVARARSIMRVFGFLARHSPTVAGLCARLGRADRESLADLAATSVTRYPPALADTLLLMDQHRGDLSRRLPRELVRLTSWQWCAPLESDSNTTIGLSLSERAQALREL
jgi:hypothetical protein